MRTYIVELIGPPYPSNGPRVFAYRKPNDWDRDFLSPDLYEYWEVNGENREDVIAKAMLNLYREKLALQNKFLPGVTPMKGKVIT